MPVIAEVAAISSSLNVVLNMAKAMLSIRDQATIQEKVVELTSEIMTAQQNAIAAVAAQSALIDRVADLEKQIVEMETWETEKLRYQLREASRIGTYAYVLRSAMSDGEPAHYLCVECYHKRKKTILQGVPDLERGFRVYHCSVCRTKIAIEPERIANGQP